MQRVHARALRSRLWLLRSRRCSCGQNQRPPRQHASRQRTPPRTWPHSPLALLIIASANAVKATTRRPRAHGCLLVASWSSRHERRSRVAGRKWNLDLIRFFIDCIRLVDCPAETAIRHSTALLVVAGLWKTFQSNANTAPNRVAYVQPSENVGEVLKCATNCTADIVSDVPDEACMQRCAAVGTHTSSS